MKKDNRGVTLVELIIIIAIMGIIITMLVVNISYINNSAAKGGANSLKTAIGQTRIKTMGKKETYLYIFKDGDGYSAKTISLDSTSDVKKGKVESIEKIAKNRVVISYSINDGTEEVVDTTNPLLIGFKRDSGKLDMTESGFSCDDGSTVSVSPVSDVKKLVLIVQSGNNIYDITVHGATGKAEMAKR